MKAIYSGIRDLFHLCVSKETEATLSLDIVIAVSGGGFPLLGATNALSKGNRVRQGERVKGLLQKRFPIRANYKDHIRVFRR